MNAIIHKLRDYTACLVAVYFVFPIIWASYLVAFFVLLSLICGIMDLKQLNKNSILRFFLLALPFLMVVVFVQVHGGKGNDIIEKSLSFIAFPVAIFLGNYAPNTKALQQLMKFFVIGVTVLVLKGCLMYVFTPYQGVYNEAHDFSFRFRSEFNHLTKVSPTYVCMYIAFCIPVLLLMELKKKEKIIFYGLGIFLFLSLFLLLAKMPMIALIIICILLLLRKNIRPGSGHKMAGKWVIGGGIVLIVILFVFTRWGELISGLQYKTVDQQENSVGIRKGIATCALQLANEHFLLGAGPQHVQQELNRCYYQFEGNDFRHAFNTHNQYLDFVVSYGLIGILLLSGIIFASFRKAMRQNDPFLFSLIALLTLCMLTENILNRQAGIIFAWFFLCTLWNRKREP